MVNYKGLIGDAKGRKGHSFKLDHIPSLSKIAIRQLITANKPTHQQYHPLDVFDDSWGYPWCLKFARC